MTFAWRTELSPGRGGRKGRPDAGHRGRPGRIHPMLDMSVILTIGSVCIGFVLMVTAASGARGGWNRAGVIALFVAAVCFLTVVPLTVALTAGV